MYKKNKTKTKLAWFVYSLGITLESMLVFKTSLRKTTVTLTHSYKTAAWPTRILWPSVWLVVITTWAGVNRMNSPQLGHFNFLPLCIHCMFIKDSNPSGKSGAQFSMWVTMLYYTWHLSIKEETLLKQTEVKLVLSSTSDLPLLLSSKRKFVLEQW